MPLRYVCPHCQGSGTKFGFALLSFIKCKVCGGDGHVVMSNMMSPNHDKQNPKEHADSQDQAK